MRTPKSTPQRGSGGPTVFVKDVLVNNNTIRRIFTNMSECAIFIIDSIYNDGIHDIVPIVTYVAPERSPFYSSENDDEIVIVNENIFSINSVYPDAEIFLAGRQFFWTISQMKTLTLSLEILITQMTQSILTETLKI